MREDGCQLSLASIIKKLESEFLKMIKHPKSFASDNYAGVHPDVLKAIIDANQDHAKAYGDDIYTQKARELFKEHFGKESEVFFVFNGTAANVLSLAAVTNSYHAILCAETSHLNNDECGAPEKITGCKLLTMPSVNRKINPEQKQRYCQQIGDQHRVQPKAISISQSTEYGTVYSMEEIKTITRLAHQQHLLVHMDGARLANAAVSLNVSLREITADAGIDVLSFGGTKNGLMFGEAVVFFDKHLAKDFLFIRKQNMQLASKMRFIAAQFIALLSNNLWHKNAEHANQMARYLENKIKKSPSIKITRPVEANAVFAALSSDVIKKLQEKFDFYVWDESLSEVRWMTAFDTTEKDIDDFVDCLISLDKT